MELPITVPIQDFCALGAEACSFKRGSEKKKQNKTNLFNEDIKKRS